MNFPDDVCTYCGTTTVHYRAYYYRCPTCGFEYKCDPTDRPPISIIKKSIHKKGGFRIP